MDVSGAFPTPHLLGISASRAAALVTGAAGTYTAVPLDATSALVPALSASLVAGAIQVDGGARYCLAVSGGITSLVGCDGAGVRVKVDGVVVARAEGTGLTIAAGSTLTRSATTMLDLVPGQVITLEIMSSGVGGCAVITSADVTSVVLSAI